MANILSTVYSRKNTMLFQAPPTQLDLPTIAQWIGYASSLITFLAVASAAFWFVFRGKSQEQLKEAAANWENLCESFKAKVAEQNVLIAELKLEIAQLQDEQETTRKFNLRLQGTVEKLEQQLRLRE